MENYTLLETFDEEYEGIPYNVEIFYSRQNRATFCKISFSLPETRTIQKDSYSNAVIAVEKAIAKHLENEKIKVSSKRFLVIAIAEDSDWHIGEYYQDLENYDERQWISVNDPDEIMYEVSQGVWLYMGLYYIVVETKQSENSMSNILDTIIEDSLPGLQKIIAKKIQAIEKKREKKE